MGGWASECVAGVRSGRVWVGGDEEWEYGWGGGRGGGQAGRQPPRGYVPAGRLP